MRPMNCAAVVVAAVLGCAAVARGGDLIQKRDGSFTPSIKGESPSAADYEASTWQVLDATIDEIRTTLTAGGKAVPQTLKASDSADIWLEPRDYPSQWKEASDLSAAGNNKRAADLYRAIGAAAQVHPVVRQKALLFAARAVWNSGDTVGADAAYDALLKTFPTSYYTRSVWKDRWQMWMDGGNEEKAKAAIDQLLKLPGVTEADQLEARLALNTIAFRKAVAAKDVPGIQKALDEYKAIAQLTQGKKEMASVSALARIGQANCLLALGKTGEARAIFEDLAERGTENAVLAAAWNGLGECWYKDNNPKGWAEARRCFLRTSLMYDEGTPGDVVAKALYFAGDCFFRLQDSEAWRDNAKKELQSCISRFPKSPWADQSRKLWNSIPK